jgi:hypothetical protein
MVTTTGSHIEDPFGVAIDTDAGRIYWGNWGESTPASIGFALLNGTGGSVLSTVGATKDEPEFPSLLKKPRASAKPGVRGGHRVGARLTCVPHWAGDVLGAFLYRRPVTSSVRWLRNGRLVPGASTKTLRTHRPGSYRCRAKATNQAGTTLSTSAGHRVR